MPGMEIKQKDDGKNGVFFIEANNELLAEMTYTWIGQKLFSIDHTEVNDALEGNGVGKELVLFAVEFAREQQIKILPLCSFAKHVFDTMPAYNDVLKPIT
jgi:predicted GNAT family acetyltransferase